MAWGRSKPQPPPSLLRQAPDCPPPPLSLRWLTVSKRSKLIPLILVFTVLAGLAFVGYQIYLSATKMKGNVSERMGKKNVVWTKDGVKVGVKHVENEREVDTTQKYFVNAWNMRSNKEKKNGKKHK